MPTVLESVLDPISRDEFRERYYGREPLLIRGHPEKFAHLFTWADFNRLLNTLSYPHPYVHVVGSGRDDALPPGALIERCRAGDSLVFARLHLYDPRAGELARALEAEMGEPVFVTLFLSQPSKAAFARHYDRPDVFVLHVAGHKAWSVYDRTVDRPILDMLENPYHAPGRATMECELAPGDVLYLPRGYWHQALAQRGSSVHLSVGVNARTGIDFLTWLMDQLRGDVRFRHELPLSFSGEPGELRGARLREHIAGLGDILLSRMADAGTIHAFHRQSVLSDRDARPFKFPAQLFDAPATQLGVQRFTRPARQRVVLDEEPAEDQIALNVWGHVFRFPRTARPLIEFIVSRTAFALEDALAHAGELSEQGVRDVLDQLLREGILDAAG